MIEFKRYLRLKPRGLAWARVEDGASVAVYFKRFDNEDGHELEMPERSVLGFEELEATRLELEGHLAVVRELLALRPK